MTETVDCFAGHLTRSDEYIWGNFFNSSWQDLTKGMSARADAYGLNQEESRPYLVWKEQGVENCRWVFVDDPSNIHGIREVYNNEANAKSPACYVVVKQVQTIPASKISLIGFRKNLADWTS